MIDVVSRSYEKINYSLRPAKHIERGMIADALSRLRAFGALHAYQYVGFGSTYFADFSLFHRRLGFTRLTSIEVDEDNRARFEFNNPLGMIDLRFGLSTDLLPVLDWGPRSVVWLDYDGMLDATALADVALVAALVPSGSVLIVSVNVHKPSGASDQLVALKQRVGETAVPVGTTEGDLAEWGLAAVGRRIIHGAVEDALVARSAATRGVTWRYRQLFNFRYRDGAKMNTVGGVIYDAGQEHLLDSCGFSDFPFVRTDVEAYEIGTPQITLKEARQLASQLPLDPSSAQLLGVPEADAVAFAELYRYFPTYIDVELL